jgi:hypothetical protein
MEESGMIEKFTPKDGRPLDPYEREVLTILQEEAAEVIQAASKLLRFGEGVTNPVTGVTNTKELGLEIGDLRLMLQVLYESTEIVDPLDIGLGMRRKRERLAKFLQTTPPNWYRVL